MTEREYSRIGEVLLQDTLPNGLPIYIFPKKEFGKSYAFFATNYGGMDMKFRLEESWQDTPEGVAHFLEHKMFDTKDGNALQDLASNGASPNAFTSSAITGYYFECTDKFEDNLRILLSFVSIPWFTKESVDKEQGIIGQEISMLEDDPGWEVFMNLMTALYRNHPIRESVAGSQESISHITPEILYACHKAFYHPSNMVLCVPGNVDAQRILGIAREILPSSGQGEIERDYGEKEPENVAQGLITKEMEVSTPIFQLGCKADVPERGEARLRQKLLGQLASEALLGTSSPLYARLYAKGLLNNSFSYGYEDYPGCAFMAAGGESQNPEAVRDAVMEEVARIGREGLAGDLWERLKKAAYGSQVRSLNAFEHLCVEQAQSHFAGFDYLRFPEIFETIGKQDAEDCIRRWFTPDRVALSVVRPGKAKT
jgi:predicted Zn-dependent peptidase